MQAITNTRDLLAPLTLDQISDLVNDMRDWILDCQWADHDEDSIMDLSDAELLQGITNHYSGGLQQFLIDNNY